MSKKRESTVQEAEERLKQLFLETQLGIELDELMRDLVPPDNPWWGEGAVQDSEDGAKK